MDIVILGEEFAVIGIVEKNDNVVYERAGVHKRIDLTIETTDDAILILLAVHRTFCHEDMEYFVTNIRSTENVIRWCEKHCIKKMLFSSSIAPFGAIEELKKRNNSTDSKHSILNKQISAREDSRKMGHQIQFSTSYS